MIKPGDTVRYLNAVGGGKVTRTEGQIAYVDEEGFETPVLMRDLVVVLPAGAEKPKGAVAAKLMFDQKAVDAVKARNLNERQEAVLTKDTTPEPKAEPVVVEETSHGEKLNLTLAFEPADIKRLSSTRFAAVLVNDSNYFLYFTFAVRDTSSHNWKVCYCGEVEPNMVVDLANITHEELPDYAQIALQAVAFKKEKNFELKNPVNVSRRLDLTKFYKLHCFRKGLYFDTPVLEVPLVTDDVAARELRVNAPAIADAMMAAPADKADLRQLSQKFNADKGRSSARKEKSPGDNPTRLLPPIEVDLHINQLLDSTAGMSNSDMLGVQLDTVRNTMRRHARRKGQKIIFIHGKGEGVLRKAVLDTLRKEYPKAELQDASFREYGFGATLVTIH